MFSKFITLSVLLLIASAFNLLTAQTPDGGVQASGAGINVIQVPFEGKMIEITVRGQVLGVKVDKKLIGHSRPDAKGVWKFRPGPGPGPIMLQVTPQVSKDRKGVFLGVVVRPVDEPVRTQLGLDKVGLVITGVTPDSAAARAMILPNDIIVTIDDEPVGQLHDLQVMLRKKIPGDKAKVSLLRGGKVVELDVSLGQGITPRASIGTDGFAYFVDAALPKDTQRWTSQVHGLVTTDVLHLVQRKKAGDKHTAWVTDVRTDRKGHFEFIKSDRGTYLLHTKTHDERGDAQAYFHDVQGQMTGLGSIVHSGKIKPSLETRLARIEKKLKKLVKLLED